MHMFKLSLATFACTLPLLACAASTADLKPFPAPSEGYKRYVIELPKLDNEDERKVELIAGKNMQVDCNQHRLGGQWQEETAKGWGYNYYQLNNVGPAASTLMACLDSSKKDAFVTAGGEPELLRYNSKLPLVVYVPEGLEVRYRVWSASPESTPASVQ